MTTQLLWWHFLNSRCFYFTGSHLASRHALHLMNTLSLHVDIENESTTFWMLPFISPSVQEYSHKLCSLTCPTSKIQHSFRSGKRRERIPFLWFCQQELCIQHTQLFALWDVALSWWRKEQVHWQQDRCSANSVRMCCTSLWIYGLLQKNGSSNSSCAHSTANTTCQQ
jgi:hypothetical protein